MADVYYNEIDPNAAAWLRNLIAAGLLPAGDVDERSIADVQPGDLTDYTQAHFFAGIGTWAYALRLAGWGRANVWTGSCPCQPFSVAGKGRGFRDDRHLWPDWFRLIAKCRPVTVFGEQVASKDGLAWLDVVYADLEGAGYAVGAVDLCAAGIGAPHIRQRLWFVADGMGNAERISTRRNARAGTEKEGRPSVWAERDAAGSSGPVSDFWRSAEWLPCRDGKSRPVEPGSFPLAHRATARVGRLRAYGNAIVAPLAAEFIGAFMDVA